MDLLVLQDIAGYAKQGGTGVWPALSICSGRPMPYVECVSQLLGIQMPVLFESGGGIFDPKAARVHWSPHLTDEVLSQVQEVTRWFEKDCVPGTKLVVDFAKRAHAGVIGPDPEEILATIPRVEAFVEASGLNFDVLPTHLSIDVVPAGITKEEGMQWLARMLELNLQEIAYIGDSLGDLEALKMVAHSFAPENARDVVKESVTTVVAAGPSGVREAIKLCAGRNQQTIEIEELRNS